MAAIVNTAALTKPTVLPAESSSHVAALHLASEIQLLTYASRAQITIAIALIVVRQCVIALSAVQDFTATAMRSWE